MDTAPWQQETVVEPFEELITNSYPKPARPAQPPAQANSAALCEGGSVEKKARPQKDKALNCPRCNSTNTKFCYYNNYSLTQPRYFCKACRRYWTQGGSLRNIPVGGGSRKNRRSRSFNPPHNSASPAPKKQLFDRHLINPGSLTGQNPKFHETQDLNLSFPHGFRNNFAEFVQNSNSFMGLPVRQDPLGFGDNIAMQELKPTTLLGFSLDGLNGGHGFQLDGVEEEPANRKLLFPFEDLKLPVSSSMSDIDQKQGDGSAAYWNGMLSGGWW